ncbi:TPA: cell envelope integrity protein TolA [Aeromonas veronii]
MVDKNGMEGADDKLNTGSAPEKVDVQLGDMHVASTPIDGSEVGQGEVAVSLVEPDAPLAPSLEVDGGDPDADADSDATDGEKPKLKRNYEGRNPRDQNEREKRMLSIMKVVIKRDDSFTTMDLRQTLTAVYRNWAKAGKVTAVMSDISSAIKTMGFEVTGEASLKRRGRSPLIYQLIPQELTAKGKMIYLTAMHELGMEPETFDKEVMEKIGRMFKSRADAKKRKDKEDVALKAADRAKQEQAAKLAAEQEKAEQEKAAKLAAEQPSKKAVKAASSTSGKKDAKKKGKGGVKIQLGKKVKWTSQSAGYQKEKKGVVVFVANPEADRRSPIEVAAESFPGHIRMFDGTIWQKDGVLVEVRDGATDAAKPKLYMPRVSALSITK